MDTNFNAALYQEEMLSLVNTAIKKRSIRITRCSL